MTVRNRYLFTQAYLDQVMADPRHDEAAATLAQGLSDWAAFRDDASLSTLIDSWVGPVLDILGFHHQGVEGQPGLERLYTDLTAQQVLGICLTVPPGADIDSTIKGVHYAYQIIAALRDGGCTWGVLTDGSLWRLVSADVLRPYETYLEVDLGQMRTRPPAETMRVFHTFFRRDAFLPDDEGKTTLDGHLACSEEVAEAIQKHLKDKMESVLGALCRGFVMADGRESYTDEQRAEIFDNATYLLYRILFILYAEARGLLPLGNPAYDEIGMQRLVEQAVRYHKQGVPDPASTTLWDGLLHLSKAIYEGDDSRGVPAYNGGLFSDEDADDFSKGYLRDCSISDPHLASALFDLTHRPSSNAPDEYESIGYRDLSVRALGGLYEGMLEYKLFLADQKIYGIPDRKGGFQYKPATQVERPKRTYREIEAGDVYFAHSPTQRKATGSYYTPEYIVDYIVKQTVERGLRQRRELLEGKITDWLREVAGALGEAERIRLQKAVDRELLRFVEEEVLAFRVCDPAMGSGHFLVNAAHTIANFIVETLNRAPWENAELDADPTIWRRRLVESCIYGVDLNPLAVELAKLSLWLATVAEGKPLNFLDHHLKTGNSLIGAWVEKLATLPRPKKRAKTFTGKKLVAMQASIFDQRLSATLPAMLRKTLEISERPSEKPADIKGKEAANQDFRELKAPFKAVADLWVSTYFGNGATESEYKEALEHIGQPKHLPTLTAVQRVEDVTKEKRFFHWELEFPEVFYTHSSMRPKPGFDAVVGNPPYVHVRTGLLKSSDSRFLTQRYDTAVGQWDVFGTFIERSFELMTEGGIWGFIIPRRVVANENFEPVRALLLSHTLKSYLDCGTAFPEAGVEACVLVAAKAPTPQGAVMAIDARIDSAIQEVNSILLRSIAVLPFSVFPVRNSGREVDLATRIIEAGDRVGDHLLITRGIEAGMNDPAFVRVQAGREPRGAYPCIAGQDVDRYSVVFNNWFVVPDHENTSKFKTPEVFLQTPKILIRFVANFPIAALDDAGYYNPNTLYNGHARKGTILDLRFVLACLNSALITWWFKLAFLSEENLFPHIQKSQLVRIPLPRVCLSMPKTLRTSLLAEASRVSQACIHASDPSGFLPLLMALQSERSKGADVLHDLLVLLVDQMIEMHKENQAETKRFLRWLAGYTGLRIDDWRLKTRVKAYWEHGWDEVRRALTQNRKAIEKASGRNVEEGGSALETIHRKFDQSVSQLEPLVQRIATTDPLIDLIVYRLYGLTEDEVAIVEERM